MGGLPHRMARTGLVVAATGMMLFGTACCRQAIPQQPEIALIREALDQREAQLTRVYSVGTVDLRWIEDGQRFFEQGRLYFFLDMPDRMGMQIEKFQDFFFLGTADERFWLFDLRDRRNRLAYIGSVEAWQSDPQMPQMLQPLRLFDMMGLATPSDEAVFEFDEGARLWMIEVDGRNGPLRMYFGDRTWFPVRVEALDAAGEVILTSTLSEYVSVDTHGRSPNEWPQIARRMLIETPDGESSVLVALDRPVAQVDESRLENILSFEFLHGRLRPHETFLIGQEPGQP